MGRAVASIASELGSCKDAFDEEISQNKIDKILKSRPPLISSLREVDKHTLLAANFGMGTTGTHVVHDALLRLYPPPQVHHYHEAYAGIVRNIIRCLGRRDGMSVQRSGAPVMKEQCQSQHILNSLGVATGNVLKNSVFLSDTPMSWLFPDLFRLVPQVVSISTFRDMDSFLDSRARHHGDDFMCHRSLWNSPDLLHPFDIVACLRLKVTVSDALQYVQDLSKREGLKLAIRAAYMAQNTVNAIIANKNGKLMAICLQDFDRREALKVTIGNIVEHFNKTHTLWGADYRNMMNLQPVARRLEAVRVTTNINRISSLQAIVHRMDSYRHHMSQGHYHYGPNKSISGLIVCLILLFLLIYHGFRLRRRNFERTTETAKL